MNAMLRVVLGWAALLIILSPLVAGYVIAGDEGLWAGIHLWLATAIVATLTGVAYLIGAMLLGDEPY